MQYILLLGAAVGAPRRKIRTLRETKDQKQLELGREKEKEVWMGRHRSNVVMNMEGVVERQEERWIVG
jgi:hypothetical protein